MVGQVVAELPPRSSGDLHETQCKVLQYLCADTCAALSTSLTLLVELSEVLLIEGTLCTSCSSSELM